jgi:hypothetical protein
MHTYTMAGLCLALAACGSAPPDESPSSKPECVYDGTRHTGNFFWLMDGGASSSYASPCEPGAACIPASDDRERGVCR